MLATSAIPSVEAAFPLSHVGGIERSKSATPRLGGLRSIGEILPLVLAQHAAFLDPSPLSRRGAPEAVIADREVVIAVRISPSETPRLSPLEYSSPLQAAEFATFCQS
jgi:hypothetical protein